jgi:hypothetical protein
VDQTVELGNVEVAPYFEINEHFLVLMKSRKRRLQSIKSIT